MNIRFRPAVVLLAILPAMGCGGADRPSLVKVSGKVLLDGKPVEGATVVFKRENPDPKYRRPSRAMTNAQGEFTPGTYDSADGIPPGKYKVGVMKMEYVDKPANFNEENPAATPAKIRWLVPKPVSDPEKSGLVVEVTSSGITPSEIKLETGGAPPVVESTATTRRSDEP